VLLFLIVVAFVVLGAILWPLAQYFHFLVMPIVQIVLGFTGAWSRSCAASVKRGAGMKKAQGEAA